MGDLIPIIPATEEPNQEMSPEDDFYWSLDETQRLDYDAMGIRFLAFWDSLDEFQRKKHQIMMENSEPFTGEL